MVTGERYEVVLGDRRAILEVSTAPVIGPSGEQTGAVAVMRDATVRERAERAERDFVTNAAHELQSPLAAIVSAIEVLQAGAKDGPERDVFLGHIEREADRLARLVRALLVLARTQIGMEAPRDELVALCPLLEEIRAGLRVPSGVELVIDCPGELAVVTNRELVEQAVVNLAENAAKQTESGRIVLSGADLGEGTVEIAVSDTGPGHFRCRAIADLRPLLPERHRLEARFRARSGDRACRRRCARRRAHARVGDWKRHNDPPPSPQDCCDGVEMSRVLVVDDEPAIRDAVEYALRSEGFQVQSTDDGERAFAQHSRTSSTSWSSTSCFRGCPAWRSAAASGARARSRSSC